MACITSSPVLPAIWSGRATPGPGPAARRCRISCSWASQVSRLSFALMGCSITVAYAFIVDTINSMSPVTTASNPTTTAVKPQGCTNLKLRQLMRRVAQHYDNEVGKSGLKGTQYSLLSYVVKLGPILAVDLAAAGWLAVGPGADARSHLISATEAGQTKRAEAQRRWRVAQEGINRALCVERVVALHSLLDEAMACLSPVAGDDELSL